MAYTLDEIDNVASWVTLQNGEEVTAEVVNAQVKQNRFTNQLDDLRLEMKIVQGKHEGGKISHTLYRPKPIPLLKQFMTKEQIHNMFATGGQDMSLVLGQAFKVKAGEPTVSKTDGKLYNNFVAIEALTTPTT